MAEWGGDMPHVAKMSMNAWVLTAVTELTRIPFILPLKTVYRNRITKSVGVVTTCNCIAIKKSFRIIG